MYYEGCNHAYSWKHAIAVLFHKRNGNKSERDWFRLLNVPGKVFGKIMIESVQDVTMNKI